MDYQDKDDAFWVQPEGRPTLLEAHKMDYLKVHEMLHNNSSDGRAELADKYYDKAKEWRDKDRGISNLYRNMGNSILANDAVALLKDSRKLLPRLKEHGLINIEEGGRE